VTVLDASAAVELLLALRRAEVLQERLFHAFETLHAPHLLDVEVAQVIRRYAARGEISAARGAQALADLREMRLTRYAHEPLLERVWQLRANASAYDATYLALAETLDVPLVTCDAALAAVPGVRAPVEVF